MMTMKYASFFVFFYYYLSGLSHAQGVTPRIVGGEQAKPGEFPYFVSLGGCGGSLIAKGVVLTAAHCADFGSLVGSFALVGAFDVEGLVGNVVKSRVIEQFIHPDYASSSISHDFMLLRIEDEIEPNNNTITNVEITINDDDNLPENGQDLTVIGLGLENEDTSDSPDALREVVVQTVSHQECFKQYGGEVEEDSMFCAGVDGGGKDSCQGDSGGPIIIRKGDQHIQVGIVSWGEGCAREDFAGVYSRISHVIDWMESVVCGCWEVSSATFCGDFVPDGEECPTPPPVFVPDPDCGDLEGFVDEFGDPCSWYEFNDSPGCPVYGDIGGGSGFDDITPLEACCYCGGGGEMGPTMAPGPTMFPTVFVPDPDCTDYAGFIDDFDDDCAWYSENEDPGCRDEGDTVGGFGFVNVTANEACCYCGGGGDRGPTPAPFPTPAPSVFATIEDCVDLPGWMDRYDDGCDWYNANEPIGCPDNGQQESEGNGFTGITAAEACCHCGGGGNYPTPGPVVSPPPTAFELDPSCRDMAGWEDFCGDPCSWYLVNDDPGCPSYGDIQGDFEFDDVAANEACCYCGGGSSNGGPTPTRRPTLSPVAPPEPTPAPTELYIDPNCMDHAGYLDIFGDSCKWYSLNDEPGCPLWGHYGGGQGFGDLSAQTACCHCGGGLDRNSGATDNPRPSTTAPAAMSNPTLAPTASGMPSATILATANESPSSASVASLWIVQPLLMAVLILGFFHF